MNSDNLEVALRCSAMSNRSAISLCYNLFIENSPYAIVLNYKLFYTLWKVLKSQKVGITQLAIGIDAQVTHHVVAMEKSAEYTNCTKCNK